MKTIKSVGCLIIVWGGTLAAADTLWTGAAGNNLLAGSNWTLGVPTNSQPGLIGAGGRAEILNNPANSAEQHTLSNKVLTLQGDATLTSRTTDAVKLSGGTLNLKGQSAFIHTLSAAGLFLGTWGPGVITLEADAKLDLGGGRFNLDSMGATLQLAGASRFICGEFRGGSGIVTLSGGQLIAGSIPGSRFGSGSINLLSGGRGTITVAGENFNFGPLLTSGRIRLDGATQVPVNSLIVDNDVPGETTVSSYGRLSKVWSAVFDAGMLVATPEARAADADGDGQSNYEEMKAGTNPRDVNSKLSVVVSNGPAANQVTFTVNSLLGKAYQVHAADVTGIHWSRIGDPVPGTGGQLPITINVSAGQTEFWVSVVDRDQDGDQLTDWEERAIKGFDPTNPDSFGTGQPGADLILAQDWAAGVTNQIVSVSTVSALGYEKEQTPAVIRISRTGSSARALPVILTYGGDPDGTKGSASTSDFVLKSVGGAPISGAVLIPAGSSSVEVLVAPVQDGAVEVPETLACGPLGSTQRTLVKIHDATNVPANDKLLVAQLAPMAGVTSEGSGIATIRLKGDNASALVNIRFYGLTSSQATAILTINSPLGTHLKSLPRGQAEDASWDIIAGQILTTDQAVLDKLLDAGIHLNIASITNPSGEISGPFVPISGSTELVIPPAPPALPALTGSDLERDIFRFLTQATFGPTQVSVEAMKAMVMSPPYNGDRMAAFSAWIDNEFSRPSPDLAPAVDAADAHERYLNTLGAPSDDPSITKALPGNQTKCWHTYAIYAPDQLRRRSAFALSEIFVINDDDRLYEKHVGVSHFEDMLKNGCTGSFRTLLEGVATHPTMGLFLSHLRNQKARYDASGNPISLPDENFAREVMQLFSIGLLHLHEDGSLVLGQNGLPLPTYEQTDITEMAKVFTGWGYSRELKNGVMRDNANFFMGDGGSPHQERVTQRMKNFSDYHDTGAKTFPVLGFNIPAGGTGETDLDAVMDFLSNHPSTAPFIIRRIIQRLVTSNPSAGYIYRVTQVWKNTGGNLGAVIKAVLLDYEARSLDVAGSAAYGRKKEPVVQAIGWLRVLQAHSDIPFSHLADTGVLAKAWYGPAYAMANRFPTELAKFETPPTFIRFKKETLEQLPFGKPSVFNWFLPDFTLPGAIADAGLAVPEFQTVDAITSISQINRFFLSSFVGRDLRTQTNVDANGDPHPVYNPFGYRPGDVNVVTSTTGLEEPYMQIMDTNGDETISPADSAFNQRNSIIEACAALVDQFDLYYCSGALKARHGAGFSTAAPREDNPRDIIIHTVYLNSTSDASINHQTQMSALQERLRLASALVMTSPCGMIQK
ncbi:DUF1800 family protein [Verrucomicrobium spinosum]|uniref:DUF1800 family protein n=1 Tax=Verrucomicrobium spinosum TaxID=2736 RepID=UPI0012F6E239|nr:DUF1800 family protein [Verrucomicrobium spinosum]